MRDKIFHRYVIIAVTVILVVTVGIKAYTWSNDIHVSQWNYRQIERINRSQENFTFIVFGDNKNSEKIFNELIERINRENASFAVDDGDIVMEGGKLYYESFLKQAEKFNKPLLTVIGNHEIYGGGRGYYYDIFGPYYYSFSVGESLFIMLDNANEHYVDPWQMEWLEEQLKAGQNYTYRFVFMHVPLYDPRVPMDEQPGHSMKNMSNARELNALFDRYNVSMLFCGHIHGFFNGTWGKTPYIITAGAGAEMVGGSDPKHYFYHYIKVHVTPNGFKWEVVRLNIHESYAYRILYTIGFHLYVYMDMNALNIIILVSSVYLVYFLIFVHKEWLKWNFSRKE